jgi:hypothetical protein
MRVACWQWQEVQDFYGMLPKEAAMLSSGVAERQR